MLQAQATLAYGLTVRAIDLYLVADGWHRLTAIDKTLSFIDLVCLRRQRGSLVVSTTSKIAQVPVEIWIKVREWLVLEAVADSQNRKLHEILCINHSGQDVSDRLTISELHGLDCGQCLDGLYESCFTLHDRWIDPAELVSLQSQVTILVIVDNLISLNRCRRSISYSRLSVSPVQLNL